MERDVTINRVLRDMQLAGLLWEEHRGEVRKCLELVWAAGREHKRGTPSKNGKKVIQYDRDDKKIGEYDNAQDASRKLKISASVIYESIWYGRPTKKGYYWKHKEENAGSNHLPA